MPDLVFPRTPFPKEGDCIPLTPPAPHVHPSHSLRSHSSLRREVKASHPKQGRTPLMNVKGQCPCQLYSDVGWREIFGSYSEGSEEGALPPNPRWGVPSPTPCLLRLPVPPKIGVSAPLNPFRTAGKGGTLLATLAAAIGGRMLSILFFFHFSTAKIHIPRDISKQNPKKVHFLVIFLKKPCFLEKIQGIL